MLGAVRIPVGQYNHGTVLILGWKILGVNDVVRRMGGVDGGAEAKDIVIQMKFWRLFVAKEVFAALDYLAVKLGEEFQFGLGFGVEF
jgi:hypothetical protein